MDGGDGFTNTSRVLVEYRHSLLINFSTGSGSEKSFPVDKEGLTVLKSMLMMRECSIIGLLGLLELQEIQARTAVRIGTIGIIGRGLAGFPGLAVLARIVKIGRIGKDL